MRDNQKIEEDKMALQFTEEQEMFRDTARRFAEKEVEPLANKIDEDEHIPPSLIKRCGELSFFGLYTPEAYGGLGQNLTSSCLVLEELSKASPSLGGLLSVQIVLCPATLVIGGSEDQ